MKNKYSIGDRVSILNEAMQGEILSIGPKGILVLRDDEFEEYFEANELVPVPPADFGLPSFHPDQIKRIVSEKEKSSRKISSRKHQDPDCWKIDLHLHELLPNSTGMSNYEIVQFQLGKCEKFIEKAIRQKVPKLIIVHGVGQGVLREEVHRLLKVYGVREYYDADYQEFGWGATEVIL